jgi:hypothetical protein
MKMKTSTFLCFLLQQFILGWSVKRHEYLDQRYHGEYTCQEESSRQTTFGIGILEHDFNPLRPNNIMGAPIFDVEMKVSADCARWVPVGYNVESTKRSVNGIQTIKTSSLTTSSEAKSFRFGAGISVAVSKFSASANYEQGDTSSSEESQMEKKASFIRGLKVLTTHCISVRHTLRHLLLHLNRH